MKKIVNIVKVIMVLLCVYVTMTCSGCNGKDEPDADRYTYREFDLQNGSETIYNTFLSGNRIKQLLQGSKNFGRDG